MQPMYEVRCTGSGRLVMAGDTGAYSETERGAISQY